MSKLGCAAALACSVALSAQADVLTRRLDTVGQVVTNKGDEQLNPVEQPGWRKLDVKQWLAEGDNLRTGPYGAMGILFRDETQIRVHANTNLQVRNIGRRSDGETRLGLERGGVWMRAKTIPAGLSIETPSATVSVRGTDWSLTADENGAATLTVLSGQVRFYNEFGEVLVERGETAYAEKGKPPLKHYIIQPKDQAQWQVSASWLDIISLTGERATALRNPKGGAETLLQRIARAFDLTEIDEMRRLLDEARAAGEPPARTALFDALLALYDEHPDEAAAFLRQSEPQGQRERMAKHMAEYSVLIRQREFAAASAALDRIEREFGDYPEVALARTWRLSFHGRQEEAIPVAEAGLQRFPQEVRFHILLAYLHMLLGDTEKARNALDAAEKIDPLHATVMHLDALFHMSMRPDLQRASDRAEKALEIAPNEPQLWNDLGLAAMDLGDHHKAERAFRRAMAIQPSGPEFHANLALLYITQERFSEAEPLLRRVIDLHPSLATGYEGMGMIALGRGKNEEALEWLLRAVLLNPGLSEAQTLLAIAYLRDERFDAADKTLDTAIRYDNNDPVPYLLKSLTAQDQSQAGDAVRYARKAFDTYLRNGEVTVNGIQNSQTGNSGLSVAYSNLGLNHWADTLSQRAYNPYWANSHFSVQSEYESENARLGSLMQGLLLDPTAFSYAPRFAEFGPRRPRNDFIIGAGLTAQRGNVASNQSLTSMGFMRDVGPLQSLSYLVTGTRSYDPGARSNGDAKEESLGVGLGGIVDPDTGVVLRLNATRSKTGMPGAISLPDADDRSATTNFNGHLGLHKRLGFRDELLLMAYAARDRSRYANADAGGANLSPLDLSLVSEFGLDQARAFYRQGLYDATFDPSVPIYTVGVALPGVTALPDTLPASVDANTTMRRHTLSTVKQLQVKRMFDVGDAQAAVGAEWAWARQRAGVVRSGAQAQAEAMLLFQDMALIPQTHTAVPLDPATAAVFFPFGSSTAQAESAATSIGGGLAYGNLRWQAHKNLLLESGLKMEHADNGLRSTNRLHPQVGLAWTPTDRQWLRMAYQKQSRLPLTGPLAPMTTVGLSVPDAYVSGTSAATQLQWDSEWNERAFTFFRLDRQEIDRFSMTSLDPFDDLSAGRADIYRASAGVNLWIGERWGMSAALRQTRSRNRDAADEGKKLPLLPDRTFTLNAAWVHPSHVRMNLSQVYTGTAQADLANTVQLPAYWLTNASVNWMPAPKNWSLTFTVNNLFDRKYRVARDYAGSGRTVLLALEYRS
ncbi:tetratricopeptide repeat protein [Noviherbaspirillum sp. ST9]|uniref:tetratricopeptide repeat protein n=1 Tax=Noviherbaspirillum sp. ST9 TaxID=3401606 RepID=UPI003B58738C